MFGTIGSGKSTLFNLITRLEPPPEGSIYFAAQDVLSFDPRELRRHIGYAQQTVHLFSDSICSNIKFGVREPPSQTDIENAARAAQVYDEITSFKDAWNTEVGEREIRLSGGQKQRLALARTFIRRPQLLILDDVLSAVDHSTEKHLIEYIEKSDCAMLIASHRVSALKHCHRIIVLEAGRITDQGTYAQLSARHSALKDDEEGK